MQSKKGITQLVSQTRLSLHSKFLVEFTALSSAAFHTIQQESTLPKVRRVNYLAFKKATIYSVTGLAMKIKEHLPREPAPSHNKHV